LITEWLFVDRLPFICSISTSTLIKHLESRLIIKCLKYSFTKQRCKKFIAIEVSLFSLNVQRHLNSTYYCISSPTFFASCPSLSTWSASGNLERVALLESCDLVLFVVDHNKVYVIGRGSVVSWDKFPERIGQQLKFSAFLYQ